MSTGRYRFIIKTAAFSKYKSRKCAQLTCYYSQCQHTTVEYHENVCVAM